MLLTREQAPQVTSIFKCLSFTGVIWYFNILCFSGGSDRILLQCERPGFNPWVGKIPWRRERLPTPLFWPGEFHALYSLWAPKSQTRLSDFCCGCYRLPEHFTHSFSLPSGLCPTESPLFAFMFFC